MEAERTADTHAPISLFLSPARARSPQIDRQAEDRCHRLGQTKAVSVYRFVTKGADIRSRVHIFIPSTHSPPPTDKPVLCSIHD